MQLIDTHSHIDFEAYDIDRDAMLTRAYDVGVTKLVHPCCSLDEIPKLLEYTKRYNGESQINLYTALGVHPTEIDCWTTDAVSLIETHATHPKVKAIGETGLDYFHAKDLEVQACQREIFKTQIQIAQKFKLPLIIHTRDAFEDTQKILTESYPRNRDARAGVLHCYTGDLDFALTMIEHGFYISWSGIITYKKNDHFREIAKHIPIDRTVIETDAPFLAPQAHRGKRNEPSFVTHVAQTLAEVYSISFEDIARISTENAQRLFNI